MSKRQRRPAHSQSHFLSGTEPRRGRPDEALVSSSTLSICAIEQMVLVFIFTKMSVKQARERLMLSALILR